MEIILFIVGLIFGAFVVFMILRNKFSGKEQKFISEYGIVSAEKNLLNEKLNYKETELNELKKNTEELRRNFLETTNQLSASKANNENLNQTISVKNDEIESVKSKSDELDKRNCDLLEAKTRTDSENGNLKEKLLTQKKEIDELQKRLTTEFENIANKVLKERSNEFYENNNKNLGEILNPLKEKLSAFEKTVKDTYDTELRDRISLREEVRQLKDLGKTVGEETKNLTKALKGDVKKQGNWGEIVLERVLERSGLSLGQEYSREVVIEGENESILRPDVIVYLPDNKHIIIDSKVSLVAYERYVNARDNAEKEKAIKEHIASIKNHIKTLSEKNYQNSANVNTPDFVLMFMPIESSFAIAVQTDNELFSIAWEKKIVIVSPTTLLATLRTVASIWKQENQTKNAQEIARLGGKLYDKFAGFVEDMERIRENIGRAQKSYEDAVNKMSEGKGNIIRTAEKIKELGAKNSKQIPQSIISKVE